MGVPTFVDLAAKSTDPKSYRSGSWCSLEEVSHLRRSESELLAFPPLPGVGYVLPHLRRSESELLVFLRLTLHFVREKQGGLRPVAPASLGRAFQSSQLAGG